MMHREKTGAYVTLGALVARMTAGAWLRVYEAEAEELEPIYDAEADGILATDMWRRIQGKDIVLVRAIDDPDTVGPVTEIYI